MIIRIFFGIIFLVVVLVATSLLFGLLTVNRSLPQYEGTVEIPGLKRSVEICCDSFAIAHIYGQTDEDCYYGLGYATAQERLFQMDLVRRIGRGKLAEVLGPQALPIDKWARTIGFARIAADMRKHTSSVTKSTLEAYTAGVNAYISANDGKFGFEFDALSYKPDAWTVEDCLVIGRLMSWEMNFSFWTDAAFSDIALKLNDEQLASIFPTYPPYATTVLEGMSPKMPVRPLTPKPVEDTVKHDTLQARPKDTTHHAAVLHEFQHRLAAAMQDLSLGIGAGSNAFAISPKRSATRGALLENDLHLAIHAPSRFFLAHLESRQGLSCAGFTIPGLPIFTSGRNKSLSWGVTNGMIDECDYVVLVPEKNGAGYQTSHGISYIKTTVENITVKQGSSFSTVPVTIRTSEFGPLIDNFTTFELAKKFANDSDRIVAQGLQTAIGRNKEVAIMWNGSLSTGDEIGSFLRLPRAQKFDPMLMAEYATPCLNLVTADAQGNISYSLIGRIPVRSGSEEHILLPRRSNDSGGVWQGYVTTTTLPHVQNPATGYLVSANNPSTRNRTVPQSMNWEPPSRATRLSQLLGSNSKLALSGMNIIANDYVSLFDRDILLPPLLHVFHRGPQDSTEQYGRLIDEALDFIESWDGVQKSEDVATTILQVYAIRLMVHALNDELDPELFSEFVYLNNVPVRTIANLLDDEWNILWDDVRSPQRESRDTIIRHAFIDAVGYCQHLLGSDPRAWNWGKLHRLSYKHAFSEASAAVGKIADIDVGPAPGSLTTVVQSSYMFWKPFQTVVAPSMRFLADMSTQQLQVIQPTGNSGNIFSPHYRDMARMFKDDQLVTFTLGAQNPHWKKLTLTASH